MLTKAEQALSEALSEPLAETFLRVLKDCPPKLAASLGVEISQSVLLPIIRRVSRENAQLLVDLVRESSPN